VELQLGASVHDPTDPVGRLLFTALSMVAEFGLPVATEQERTLSGAR
jgi:DNA invertase Pin-like site-specific DNA recombinase